MKSKLIFKRDMKIHEISKLDSLTANDEGIQVQNRTSSSVLLAVYNKGNKVVNQLSEDSYVISTIHIYSDPKILNLLDEVTYDNRVYTVLEDKHYQNHSFYKATSNV